MSKKIEPGCRAVIINSKAGNNGIEVSVIGYLGDSNIVGNCIFPDKNRWIIDKYLPTTERGFQANHFGEHQLKRIDDYDGNKKASWSDGNNIWMPHTHSTMVN